MNNPKRKDTRLKDFNYSQTGVYFVTLCTLKRQNILSTISVGGGVLDAPSVELSDYGKIADTVIANINQTYNNIQISKYVIMPNHLHLLIEIKNGASGTPPPTTATNNALSLLISTFKRFSNKQANTDLWQRGFYDRIIRDNNEYLAAWQYIDTNPLKWSLDEYFK